MIGIWDSGFGEGDGGEDDGRFPGVVYFIRHPEGHIKIGYSKNVGGRLRGLQTANPSRLELIGFVQGTRSHEKALHRRLGAWRSGGEWFRPSPEVVVEVSRVLSQGFIEIDDVGGMSFDGGGD